MKDNFSPEVRKAIAKEIQDCRVLDRVNFYINNRNLAAYIEILKGLQGFTDYLKSLESSKIVLDVGAGVTRATMELSQSSLGKDLDFFATVLSMNKNIDKYLGMSKTTITSAERLRGISDSSVGGIIAVNSIAYSEAPDLVVNSFNRVLVPGGIVKATFGWMEDHSGFHSHDQFTEKFRSLGYDVAVESVKPHWVKVMVAIKPGAVNTTANDILRQDQISIS